MLIFLFCFRNSHCIEESFVVLAKSYLHPTGEKKFNKILKALLHFTTFVLFTNALN
jgi:hypothetical protein